MARTIGVGIVGSGNVSDRHARGYLENPNARLVAFADVKGELAEKRSKEFGLDTHYDSVEALLKDERIDAVDICVPNAFHSKITVQACEAGKHVLVEKPMATTSQECDEMIRASEKAKVKLMVGQTLRFFPSFVECERLMSSGALGNIVRLRATQMGAQHTGWRADPGVTGGGLLIEGIVHPLYLLNWLMGGVKEVSAMTGRTSDAVKAEDIVTVLLKSATGIFGVIDANLNGPVPLWDDRVEVVGDKGMVLVNGAWRQILRGPPLLHYHEGSWTVYNEKGERDPPNLKNTIEWSMSRAFVYVINEFIGSIVEDRKPKVDGHDGKRVIQMVEACQMSAAERKTVDLPV